MTVDRLEHLPDSKRRELELVVKILFDSFDDATKTKLSPKRKSGQILKVILFGSMARGDWVDDKISGYKSDYDLLVVVNSHAFTDLHEYWHGADERLVREFTITHNIGAPVKRETGLYLALSFQGLFMRAHPTLVLKYALFRQSGDR